jgi:hypothetical protein
MADPVKKEDTKDPVAELITALEAGKKATERLEALEKQILDRIEQAVSGSSSQTSQSTTPAASPAQDDKGNDWTGTNIYSDDSNQPNQGDFN